MNAPGGGIVLPVTPVDAVAGTVLVLENNLDERAVALVAQAVGLTHQGILRLGSDHPPAGLRPSVIIGGLPSGQRRLPAQVVELAERTFPAVPVILLCREPLARPCRGARRLRPSHPRVRPPARRERVLAELVALEAAPDQRRHASGTR